MRFSINCVISVVPSDRRSACIFVISSGGRDCVLHRKQKQTRGDSLSHFNLASVAALVFADIAMMERGRRNWRQEKSFIIEPQPTEIMRVATKMRLVLSRIYFHFHCYTFLLFFNERDQTGPCNFYNDGKVQLPRINYGGWELGISFWHNS